jgi:hypothetical protein
VRRWAATSGSREEMARPPAKTDRAIAGRREHERE